MKAREFLRVTYISTHSGTKSYQDFKMSESHLIKKVLKDIAVGEECNIKLMTCSEDEYIKKF